MKLGKAALLVAAGALFISTRAIAADAPAMPVAAPPPPAPAAEVGFDWAGPYVGGYAGRLDGFWLGGGLAGYNFVFGQNFLAGAELRAGFINDGGVVFEGSVNARLGYLLGDRTLLYAKVGVQSPAFAFTLLNVGGGIEIALGERVSVFAEAAVSRNIGVACCFPTAVGGINFHLGQ